MAVTNYISFGGMLIGEETNGVMRNYGTDALGSVVATYSNGVPENTYAYKPYGATLAKTGTASDPSFLWNGGSGYRTTRLLYSDYFIRARHFSTVSAHWITIDQKWPQQPPFGYVMGRPITYTDPSGQTICNPRPTCASLGIGNLGASGEAGDTDCCVDSGTVFILICTSDLCLTGCTVEHEQTHAAQQAPCCSLAGKCYKNANGNTAAQSDCNYAYGIWQKRNASIFECAAYAVSAVCFLDAWTSCLPIDDTGVVVTFGKPPEKENCCGEWFGSYVDDSQAWVDSCNTAQLFLHSHFDLGCPFDSKGNIRKNWK